MPRRIIALVLMLFLAGCVLPVPPPSVPVSSVPTVSGKSATITVVRKKQFAGSAPTHYISLDGATIATLEVGEYTTFQVPEGNHSLTVTWRVGDKGAASGGVALLLWSPHSKTVEINCIPSTNYFFTITAKAFTLSEDDRVDLKQVDQLEGDFATEKNRYVSPGADNK